MPVLPRDFRLVGHAAGAILPAPEPGIDVAQFGVTLVQLFRGLTAAELAGGFGLPGAAPIVTSLENEFRARLDALTASTPDAAVGGSGRSGR